MTFYDIKTQVEYVPKRACVKTGMHQSNNAVIYRQRRHFNATGFIDFPWKTPCCMHIWLYVINFTTKLHSIKDY